PALCHTFVQQLRILPLPRLALGDPDVELEIGGVVADRRSCKGALEVHVPTGKSALLALPEEPERMRIAGSLEHQHAVACPRPAPVPWMAPARPVAVGKSELCARRQIGGKEIVAIGDHPD